jgi:hypothetical protein
MGRSGTKTRVERKATREGGSGQGRVCGGGGGGGTVDARHRPAGATVAAVRPGKEAGKHALRSVSTLLQKASPIHPPPLLPSPRPHETTSHLLF